MAHYLTHGDRAGDALQHVQYIQHYNAALAAQRVTRSCRVDTGARPGVGALLGGGLVWMSLIAARARNWKLQRQLDKVEQRAQLAEEALAINADNDTNPNPSRMMLPR